MSFGQWIHWTLTVFRICERFWNRFFFVRGTNMLVSLSEPFRKLIYIFFSFYLDTTEIVFSMVFLCRKLVKERSVLIIWTLAEPHYIYSSLDKKAVVLKCRSSFLLQLYFLPWHHKNHFSISPAAVGCEHSFYYLMYLRPTNYTY